MTCSSHQNPRAALAAKLFTVLFAGRSKGPAPSRMNNFGYPILGRSAD